MNKQESQGDSERYLSNQKPPELAEISTREAMIERIMKARHNEALLAIGIENIFLDDSKSTKPQLLARKIQDNIDSDPDLSTETKNRFVDIVSKIYNHIKNVDSWISRAAYYSSEHNTQPNEKPEEKLGNYIFNLLNETSPQDSVIANGRRGYIVINCKNFNDYRLMADLQNLNEETASAVQAVTRIENFSSNDGKNIPFIVFNPNPKKPGEYSVNESHEIRHIINRLTLDDFEKIESHITNRHKELFGFSTEPNSNKNINLALADFKDEILAYADVEALEYMPKTVKKLIADEGYRDIQENLNKNQSEKIIQLLSEIADKFSKLSALFKNAEQRKLLIYILSDVPLINFPKYLDIVDEYYTKHKELLDISLKLNFNN